MVRSETKAGLLRDPYLSEFCRVRAVRRAFEQLLSAARPCAEYLVLSYSSEGLLTPAELGDILGERAARKEILHPRYLSAKGGATQPRQVKEYIYTVPLS